MLLMADRNPMGGGRAVALDLRADHVSILRRRLCDCLYGVLGDLSTPGQMLDSAKARREADAYQRLLAGLRQGEVLVPDQAAREAVAVLATAADEANDYARALAEHEALNGLLARLAPPPVP
jgi:hypothetical protein